MASQPCLSLLTLWVYYDNGDTLASRCIAKLVHLNKTVKFRTNAPAMSIWYWYRLHLSIGYIVNLNICTVSIPRYLTWMHVRVSLYFFFKLLCWVTVGPSRVSYSWLACINRWLRFSCLFSCPLFGLSSVSYFVAKVVSLVWWIFRAAFFSGNLFLLYFHWRKSG